MIRASLPAGIFDLKQSGCSLRLYTSTLLRDSTEPSRFKPWEPIEASPRARGLMNLGYPHRVEEGTRKRKKTNCWNVGIFDLKQSKEARCSPRTVKLRYDPSYFERLKAQIKPCERIEGTPKV
uniref:Uncharacterized protein n=1 Tax=Steinernema glaseri TaxID=37863 RepID=A0A1I8A941_9BILA